MALIGGLSNVAPPLQYGPPASLQCQGAVRLNITVTGGAVFYQEADRGLRGGLPGSSFGGEQFLPPGRYGWNRDIDAIEFRRAVAGPPPVISVTVEALSE